MVLAAAVGGAAWSLIDQDPMVYLLVHHRPGAVVGDLPQSLGRAAAGRRRAQRGAHRPRAPALPIQYIAVVVGGMFAGIGGAHLSIAYTKSWFENMTQGRGFVAVAVVMFAARQPFKVAAGAYLFGAALACWRCRPAATGSTSSCSTPFPTSSPSSS